MLNERKLTRILALLITLTALAFLFTLPLIFSIPQDGHFSPFPKKFCKGWTYRIENETQETEITLPHRINLPSEVHAIALTNTIPALPNEENWLTFDIMFQEASIIIDGEIRTHYGDSDAPAYAYPFVNGDGIIKARLRKSDVGKKIEIILENSGTLGSELKNISCPRIGSGFAIATFALLNPMGNSILILLLVFMLALLFIMLPFSHDRIRKKTLFILTLSLWVCFYTCNNTFLEFLSDNAPRFIAFTDVAYYFLDQLLPFCTLITIAIIIAMPLGRFKATLMFLHIALYLVSIACHVLNIYPINIFRPFLMATSFAIFLLFQHSIRIRLSKNAESKLVRICLLILYGYYFDYIKYAITIIPINAAWMDFFLLELPFDLFLSIALALVPFFAIKAITDIRAEERQALIKLSTYDPLTGVLTRPCIVRDIDSVRRSVGIWYFGILDIDKFKYVNDTYGHSKGDKALQILATTLAELIPGRKVYRYGGDEFCIFISSPERELLFATLNGIKEKVAAESEKELGFPIHFSLGLAQIEDGLTNHEIFERADAKLYQCKKNACGILLFGT